MEFFPIVAVLVALALMAAPLMRRLPEGGLREWLRTTMDELRAPGAPARRADVTDVDIEQLLTDDPDVPGYIHPDQLRIRRDDREAARSHS